MKPLYKVYFAWKEPKAYLQLKDKHELPRTRRTQGVLFFLVMGLSLFKWWLAEKRGRPIASLGEFTAEAILCSAFIAYGVPWIILKCPNYIRVREKGVFRSPRSNHLYFNALDSFCWIPMPQWSLLKFVRKSGRHTYLGVPLDVPREEISSLFGQRGLRKEPHGHWTDFEDLAFLRNLV